MTDKDENKKNKEIEVYSEIAETESPELDEGEIRAAALAYAKFLNKNNIAPGEPTFAEPEELGLDMDFDAKEETEEAEAETEEAEAEEIKEAETETEEAEADVKEVEEDTEKENEDKTEAEDIKEEAEEAETEKTEEKAEEAKEEESKEGEEKAGAGKKKKKAKKKEKKQKKTKDEDKEEKKNKKSPIVALIDFHDSFQDKRDDAIIGVGRGFATSVHTIADGYRHSRRSIGLAALAIMVLASLMLVVFDRITVYEYAYNGKVLGYVSEQEEVTDVLEVAGKKLTENNNSVAGVEFVANQNISFNLVDGRGKTTDDADTAVNKLIYMTDIETEASAVFSGGKMVAIVRDEAAATALLEEALSQISEPEPGMELVSAEYMDETEIRPVNVLLSSVQTSQKAIDQMSEGGEMEVFHIVEEDETIETIREDFGAGQMDVYDEDNQEVIEEAVQGDRVCIRSRVEPVSVKVVEEGKLRIVDEYKTIKKESDDYYQGDSIVEQEGSDGIILFEGRIEKEGGEIVSKYGDQTEIRERQDKIIIIGTAERPKTAPTGTYAMPIVGRAVTSEFGPRWGRNHDGLDFGAPTGTPIYASDGGTVTRASTYSGYGLVVEIDHENGRMTRYAHCSKLLVSAGDKVYQGQEIALVGNTGRSFGSHLHFEVHLNGTPVNPRPHLGI